MKIKKMKMKKRPEEKWVQHMDAERLREEVAQLEARLQEIGYDGDSGYEKAMVRFFEQQVDVRKAQLATR